MGKLITAGVKASEDNVHRACSQCVTMLVLLLFLTVPAIAQNRKPAVPAPAPAKDPLASNIKPSRFVSESDYEEYVSTLSSSFSMKGRETDPFGQLQDPDAKPKVIPTDIKPRVHQPQLLATPFADIVKLIQVTTIMPKDKSFLVGTRQFKQGQTILLTFRGRNIKAEVSTVSSQEIKFRNAENGDVASVKLNMLPAGMTAGTQGIRAPGMVSDKPGTPLEILDPATISNETTPNP